MVFDLNGKLIHAGPYRYRIHSAHGFNEVQQQSSVVISWWFNDFNAPSNALSDPVISVLHIMSYWVI